MADNAEKDEGALEQGQWMGMFSQRWRIDSYREFYFIRNLKSGFVATVKGKKVKEGIEIVQEK